MLAHRLLHIVTALLLLLALASPALAGVGFQKLSIPDPQGPPVEVGVWYPTDAAGAPAYAESFRQTLAVDAPARGKSLPLIVMSHGNGGAFTSHADTAYALAEAGFVAAALTHTGDNYRDQSRATDMANRPRQLKLLVDYMLSGWTQHDAIDPARIGAFGFSSGGFTVLVAGGGTPDLMQVGPHCRHHPDYYDCKLVANGKPSSVVGNIWTHDPRLKAVVAAAPALGFTFGAAGLASVREPIQLWRAADDHILPHPEYAEAVRLNLPTPPDYRVVERADHFDFLAPCSDVLLKVAPMICMSAPGFDRLKFHSELNTAVIAFFRDKLGVAATAPLAGR